MSSEVVDAAIHAGPAALDFGYLPIDLSFNAGDVSLETLPGLDKTIKAVTASRYVSRGWAFAPINRDRMISRRVFGLPRTHTLHCSKGDKARLEFLVWVISLFAGMRLSHYEAGFLDATPIETHTLTDMVTHHVTIGRSIGLGVAFWEQFGSKAAKGWCAAVHAYYLAQKPDLLSFEQISLAYTALDACFAVFSRAYPPDKDLSHARRIQWMCEQSDVPVPAWAIVQFEPGKRPASELSALRNSAIHEAILDEDMLGFSAVKRGSFGNLPLEMRHLACRLLVWLIGVSDPEYVGTPVDTRSRYLVTL
ncbi:hypothetical protein IAI18_10565 [Acetobacteraceae bacterium H6797]|nr:hypothetical protein [Acetobacteraceae bacterium H6797]